MSAEVQGIVCPKWCAVSQEEHLEELRLSWEGLVHHESAPGARATLAVVLYADGSPYGGDTRGPDVLIDDGYGLGGTPAEIAAQVEEYIRDLRAAVEILQAAS